MSNSSSSVRTRSERVAALSSEQPRWRRWVDVVITTPSLLRFAIALGVAIVLAFIIQGWNPPFAYRTGYIPPRAIIARVRFEVVDSVKTQANVTQKTQEILNFYENRPQPLTQLRAALKDAVFALMEGATASDEEVDLASLNSKALTTLGVFTNPNVGEKIDPKESLQAIREMLIEDKQLDKFDQTMRAVFQPLEENGLLDLLSHDLAQGNQEKIKVYVGDKVDEAKVVEVASVRIPEVKKTLLSNLQNEIKRTFPASKSDVVGKMVFNFVSETGLPVTLRYDSNLSEAIRKKILEELPPITTPYLPGESVLAAGGKPLGINELQVLRAEHTAWINQLPLSEELIRLVAFFGMIAAMYLLVGLYIYFQYDSSLIRDTGRFVRLMMLVFVVCWGCWFAANDVWRAEVIPIVICAITATIAYGRPLALVLLTTMIITITLSLGLGLDSLVVLGAAACSAILFLGRIRSRTRLIYVGLGSALITSTTLIGVGVMVGQTVDMVPTLGTNSITGSMILGLLTQLVSEAGRTGIYVVTACLLMTGLLPIVERLFGVQTDLSLLELGDTAHPLLRQLAQRAPGTFNHSINVAAIAEPAAEAIGGNGLLTRVGAYFHDIGKMFKPTYFVENQSGGNRHDSLQPAMSTLVIIAHVKDGADLARQYRLPQSLIDFIEQHHGTTLVEYFFRQATKKSEEDPNGEEVSEHGFRYPGPKPQSLEAAVLMLADAVESASRTLVEPTSARLQNLVNDIATKRLLDGQFEECGMTLSQLGLVKQSLVKSLTAIYHGRLKYPGQQTA